MVLCVLRVIYSFQICNIFGIGIYSRIIGAFNSLRMRHLIFDMVDGKLLIYIHREISE